MKMPNPQRAIRKTVATAPMIHSMAVIVARVALGNFAPMRRPNARARDCGNGSDIKNLLLQSVGALAETLTQVATSSYDGLSRAVAARPCRSRETSSRLTPIVRGTIMNIGSLSPSTDFALDVFGRYVCNTFDEAMASSDPVFRAGAIDVKGN